MDAPKKKIESSGLIRYLFQKIIMSFKSEHLRCAPPMINLVTNMSLQMKYGVLGRVKQTVLKSTVINVQQGTLPLQNKLHLDLLYDELIPTKGER